MPKVVATLYPFGVSPDSEPFSVQSERPAPDGYGYFPNIVAQCVDDLMARAARLAYDFEPPAAILVTFE